MFNKTLLDTSAQTQKPHQLFSEDEETTYQLSVTIGQSPAAYQLAKVRKYIPRARMFYQVDLRCASII